MGCCGGIGCGESCGWGAEPGALIGPTAGNPPVAVALVFTGGAGRAAVASIAESHSDPRVRSAARMALGKLASEK